MSQETFTSRGKDPQGFANILLFPNLLRVFIYISVVILSEAKDLIRDSSSRQTGLRMTDIEFWDLVNHPSPCVGE